MAYYYNRETKECISEIPKKDGSGMRGITIKDVRESKGLLVPSVTQINGQIEKPFLTKWFIDQAINSALTLPKIENEPLDNYKKRIIEDYQQQSEKAKNDGNMLHDYIRAFIEKDYIQNIDDKIYISNKYLDLCMNTIDFIAKNKIMGECEQVFTCKYFAGRIDFFGTKDWNNYIIDWKSQDVKNEKPVYYDEWPMQLGAYKYMTGSDYKCMSVVLSKSDGKVYSKEWTDQEISRGFEKFKKLLQFWQIDNNIEVWE